MDSTKTILKKLAGRDKGSAKWVINVSNENGELLAAVCKNLNSWQKTVVTKMQRPSKSGMRPFEIPSSPGLSMEV